MLLLLVALFTVGSYRIFFLGNSGYLPLFSNAGDFNNDGMSDLIISSAEFTNGSTGNTAKSGIAWVIFGINNTKITNFTSTVTTTPYSDLNLYTIPSPSRAIVLDPDNTDYKFGCAIAPLGDINGDRIDDIVIGQYAENSAAFARTYVIYGRTQFPLNNWPALNVSTFAGESSSNGLGAGVGGGDFNGDGRPDMVTGAIYANNNRGRVCVFFGNNTNFRSYSLAIQADGVNGTCYQGTLFPPANVGNVVTLTDITGDGKADILIGTFLGYIWVIKGTSGPFQASMSITTSTAIQISGVTANGGQDKLFASEIWALGDINDDGYNDFGLDSEAKNTFIIFGSPTISAFSASTSLPRSQGVVFLESRRGGGGYDINGDGKPDVGVVMSDYSACFIFGGKNWPSPYPVTTLNGTNGFNVTGPLGSTARFADRITFVPDVNGDGLNDIAIMLWDVTPDDNNVTTFIIFGRETSQVQLQPVLNLSLPIVPCGNNGIANINPLGCQSVVHTASCSLQCNPGFIINRPTFFCAYGVWTRKPVCLDIDECSLQTHNCDMQAACANTFGSFTCQCNVGYTGNGVTCTDINECTEGTHNCPAIATCQNTIGSFTCACNDGYTGDGLTCTDVDECTLQSHNCNFNASCINAVGSFTCRCNSGYAGDGLFCIDIDECSSNSHNCVKNAFCNNTFGSYTCECNYGYLGDGVTTCVDTTTWISACPNISSACRIGSGCDGRALLPTVSSQLITPNVIIRGNTITISTVLNLTFCNGTSARFDNYKYDYAWQFSAPINYTTQKGGLVKFLSSYIPLNANTWTTSLSAIVSAMDSSVINSIPLIQTSSLASFLNWQSLPAKAFKHILLDGDLYITSNNIPGAITYIGKLTSGSETIYEYVLTGSILTNSSCPIHLQLSQDIVISLSNGLTLNQWNNFRVSVQRANNISLSTLTVTFTVLTPTFYTQVFTASYSPFQLTLNTSLCHTQLQLLLTNLSLQVSTLLTTNTITTPITPANLSVIIQGGSYREVSLYDSLVLDGSLSRDPNMDGLPNRDNLEIIYVNYTWACWNVSNLPCELSPISTKKLTFTPGTYGFLPGIYRFVLTMTSTYATNGVPMSSENVVAVNMYGLAIPTLTISIPYPGTMLPIYDQVLRLQGNVMINNYSVPLEKFTFSWDEADNKLNLAQLRLLTPLTSRSLSIDAYQLSYEVSYTFRFFAYDTINNKTFSASLTMLPVNSPPSNGACVVWNDQEITLLPNITILNQVNFRCNGWYDMDLTIFYTFFAVSTTGKNVILVLSSISPQGIAYLPVGFLNLYVNVSDPYGSSSQVPVGNVTVTTSPEPPLCQAILLINQQLAILDSNNMDAQLLVIVQQTLTLLNQVNLTSQIPLLTICPSLASIITNNSTTIAQFVTDFWFTAIEKLQMIATQSQNVNLGRNIADILLDLVTSITSQTGTFSSETSTSVISLISTIVDAVGHDPQVANSTIKVISDLLLIVPCNQTQTLLDILQILSFRVVNGSVPNEYIQSFQSQGVSTSGTKVYANESTVLSMLGLDLNLPAQMLLANQSLNFAISRFNSSVTSLTRCRPTNTTGLGSDIISIDISNGDNHINVTNLTIPFTFTISLSDQVNVDTGKCQNGVRQATIPQCVWWDLTTNQWTNDGCASGTVFTKADGTRYLQCSCTHLTEFALLLYQAEHPCQKIDYSGFAVLAVIYAALAAFTLIQVARYVWARAAQRGGFDSLLLQHILILISALFRVLETAHFGGWVTFPQELLGVLTALPYLFIFWIFLILITSWVNLYHQSVSEISAGSNRFRPVAIGSGILFSAMMIIFFISFITGKASKAITIAASVTAAVLYLITGIGFFYGIAVAQRLEKGMSMTTESLPQSRSFFNKFQEQIWTRLKVISIAVSGAFILESILWLVSAFVVEQAATFTIAFLSFEIFALLTILALYFKTVSVRVEQRRKTTKSRENSQYKSGSGGHSAGHSTVEVTTYSPNAPS